MAKKLKVLTPQTTDGRTLFYDENEKVLYKESIVEFSAKADFEALNASLPTNLKHKLEVIEGDETQVVAMPKVEKAEGNIVEQKDGEIAELKKQLEAAKAEATKATDAVKAPEAPKAEATKK